MPELPPDGPRTPAERLFHAEAAGLRDGLVRMLRARLTGGERVGLEADALAHRALAKALEKLPAFRGNLPAQLRAWVRTIGENVLRDALRADGARRTRLAPTPEPLVGVAAGTDPSAKVEGAEARRDLSRGLSELSPDERAAVRQKYLRGRAVTDIAAALGRTEPAVGGLLKRAKAKLRRRAR